MNKTYDFAPNTYSISRPEDYHNEEGTANTDIIYISFTLNNFELENGVYKDSDGEIGKLIYKCYKELQEKKPMFQLVLNNLAERIILQFMRCNIRDKTQVDDSFAYILNYIDMNATQNLTVKQLANNIGYNYNYFRELFFSKKGVSLKEYLIEKKISCAEKLLTSTDYTLNKIATACGFNSASHFCTVFKKINGITPQAFKEQANKNAYTAEEKYLPPEFSRKPPKKDF